MSKTEMFGWLITAAQAFADNPIVGLALIVALAALVVAHKAISTRIKE